MKDLRHRIEQQTGLYLRTIPLSMWRQEPKKRERWPIFSRNLFRGGWYLRANRFVLGYCPKRGSDW